jgi:hypothetical protein
MQQANAAARAERRVYARIKSDGTAVILRDRDVLGSYTIVNLSVGGALLTGKKPLPVGEPVQVTLQLRPGNVVLDAVVARGEDGSYGLAFSAPSAALLVALDSHLRAAFPML